MIFPDLLQPLFFQFAVGPQLESLLIWGVTAAFGSGILAIYIRKHKKEEKKVLVLHQEAVALNINKPQAQYPMVNTSLCIGCGSCIDACPEGGVLGLVNGKATIINGLKCVGHGRCAEECPVEAMVVGLGDISGRDDIPSVDQNHQSNVPGLYVVGELGGLALVKNAIKQGEAAVMAIARELEPAPASDLLDVLVVGAGPAGLSAALAARRAGFSCLIVDQDDAGGTILQYPRKKMMLTQPVEIPLYGWLKKPTYLKEELLGIWDEIIQQQQLKINKGEIMEQVTRTEEGFLTRTSANTYRSRQVILALGRRGTPRKLGIPGEDSAKVAYQLLDAGLYENDRILVVGGGDSAIEAAVALARQPGNQVCLSYRKNKFFRIKNKNKHLVEEADKEGRLKIYFNSQPLKIEPETVLLQTEQGDLVLENDFVFIFAGGIPPFDLLRKSGISFGGNP